jgi:hypothetical protein
LARAESEKSCSNRASTGRKLGTVTGVLDSLSGTVVPGCRRHITQRGKNRQDVPFTDDGRRLYSKVLPDEKREALSKLRLHTNCGRPLGSDGFVARLEAAMNRRLRPLPEGRPRKKDENR